MVYGGRLPMHRGTISASLMGGESVTSKQRRSGESWRDGRRRSDGETKTIEDQTLSLTATEGSSELGRDEVSRTLGR